MLDNWEDTAAARRLPPDFLPPGKRCSFGSAPGTVIVLVTETDLKPPSASVSFSQNYCPVRSVFITIIKFIKEFSADESSLKFVTICLYIR